MVEMPQQPYSHSWTMLDMFFFQRTTWTGSGQLLQQQLLVYSRGSERWLTLLGTMMWKGKATTKGFCMSGLQYLKSMDWFEGTLPGNIENYCFYHVLSSSFFNGFPMCPRHFKPYVTSAQVLAPQGLRGALPSGRCPVVVLWRFA